MLVDDVFDDTTCESDEGKGLEGHAVDSTADEVETKHYADETPSATTCEDIASGEDVVGKDGEETGSRVTSESDQSSVTNTEVHNIFRPRNIAPAQDHLLDNDVTHKSGKLALDVADADADDFAAKTAPLESYITSKPEVAKETAGPKIPMATKTSDEDGNAVSSNSPAIPPMLSMEEEDQLQVE